MASSPVPPVPSRIKPTTAALIDDLLEEVFLRIASPTDLARASAACADFRRLITDPAFLRRYRSLHPPLLLGFVRRDGLHCVEAPHLNAAAAAALVRAAGGFSVDYGWCRAGGRWDPCDVRDGRVLLKCLPPDDSSGAVVPDLVVCDPLSRRYQMLPAISEEEHRIKRFEAIFAPCTDAEETSFRVMGMAFCETKMMVFDFSSTSGRWTAAASADWGAPIPNVECQLTWPCFANGCIYFKVHRTTKLVKLDMSTMDFSILNLPDDPSRGNIVIMEAEKGRLGMFCKNRHDNSLNYYTIMQSQSEKASKWHMEKTIPMPTSYKCHIAGEAEGYIFLVGVPQGALALPKVSGVIERVSRIRYTHQEQICIQVCGFFADVAMLVNSFDNKSRRLDKEPALAQAQTLLR
ncbi:hypothetical protein EJB05_51906, partial [Eragrostis curvula]